MLYSIRQYRDRDRDLQDKDDAELEAAREADSFSFGLKRKLINPRLKEKQMGTRNLTYVVVNSEYKVGQYGQWDGYPSGQGTTALTFLRDELNREQFFSRLAETFQPTAEQFAEYNKQIKAANAQVVDMFPSLSRDTGAKILSLIQNSTEPVPLRIDIDFAAESLIAQACEWAYVIDFDKGTFEIYKGFNKEKLTDSDRFYSLSEKVQNSYEPVKMIKSYSLDALPATNAQFLFDLEPAEEADAA